MRTSWHLRVYGPGMTMLLRYTTAAHPAQRPGGPSGQAIMEELRLALGRTPAEVTEEEAASIRRKHGFAGST
jgi:hypothetical protein